MRALSAVLCFVRFDLKSIDDFERVKRLYHVKNMMTLLHVYHMCAVRSKNFLHFVSSSIIFWFFVFSDRFF